MNIYIVERLAALRRQEIQREAQQRAAAHAILEKHRARYRAEAMRRGGRTPLTPFALLVFWFVGLNALAGAASLMLAPRHTASLFFWTIEPALSAAMFGALYLGGGAAVCLLALRGQWEPARALIPVLTSAGLLISGVTLAHLDRFGGGPRLAYWLAVYLGAAPLALAVYAAQEELGAIWEAASRSRRPRGRSPRAPAR